MHNDFRVKRRTWELWKEFMTYGIDELCEFCHDYYQYVKPSFDNNKAAGLDDTDYADQSVRAANWLRQRANFIYGQLMAEYVLAGDVNGDGKLNINDVTLLINYLLSSNSDMVNMDNADVDGNSEINISDVTTLIRILLSDE